MSEWTRSNGAGREFSREEMLAAFEAVQSENWKDPIEDKVVTVDKLLVTVAAIAFFAGSHSFVRLREDGVSFDIKAPGYYVCVGA